MRGVRREHEAHGPPGIGAVPTRLRKLLLVENLVIAARAACSAWDCYGGVGMLTALAARYSPTRQRDHVDGVVCRSLSALVLLVAVASVAPGLVKERPRVRARFPAAGARPAA